MSTQVYRSVKLVLQNSTNENLTVQGVAVLAGRWADKQEPTQGQLVPEQSAHEWSSISPDLGTGTAAFVRFGCSRGYLTLRWNLPWAGPFTYQVDGVPGLAVDVTVNDGHPDAVIMLAMISERRDGRPAEARTEAKSEGNAEGRLEAKAAETRA